MVFVAMSQKVVSSTMLAGYSSNMHVGKAGIYVATAYNLISKSTHNDSYCIPLYQRDNEAHCLSLIKMQTK